MKLRGMFTIEAAYLVAYITVLVGSIFKINFTLHDALLSDSCKVQSGIRLYQADTFFYDSEKERIDMDAIINTPVIDNDDFVKGQIGDINNRAKDFFAKKKIDITSNLSKTDISKVINITNNALITRSGQKIVKLIGGIK